VTLQYIAEQHLACGNSNRGIVHFFDDRLSIVAYLEAIFSNCPTLIPNNIQLNFHRYAESETDDFDDAITDFFRSSTDGTGSLQPLWQKIYTPGLFAKYQVLINSNSCFSTLDNFINTHGDNELFCQEFMASTNKAIAQSFQILILIHMMSLTNTALAKYPALQQKFQPIIRFANSHAMIDDPTALSQLKNKFTDFSASIAPSQAISLFAAAELPSIKAVKLALANLAASRTVELESMTSYSSTNSSPSSANRQDTRSPSPF
jgi:hypothetical protein